MSLSGLHDSAASESEATFVEEEVTKEADSLPTASPVDPRLSSQDDAIGDGLESCGSVEMTAEAYSKSFEKEEENDATARDDHQSRDQPEALESPAEMTAHKAPIIEVVSSEESVAMKFVAKISIDQSSPSYDATWDKKDDGVEIVEKTTADTAPEDEPEEEEIDLEFVEQFDNAFNEFISSNQKFIMANPDLVHNMRVSKLQGLLTYQNEVEHDVNAELEAVKQTKREMEASYQEQLREASRKKATRDIHLRSELKEVNQETRKIEASMTWELIKNSQAFAKNQQMALEMYKNDPPNVMDRSCLLELLPEGESFEAVRDAVQAPSCSSPLTEEQGLAVQQCKIDNAFLNGEITMLKKKLEHQKKAASTQGWVDSVLVRMDKKSMKKLKSSYKKKAGVQF